MDIPEAFFRISLAPESTNLSLFLMDFNVKTQELTAKATPDTKLVTIRSLVSIMGILHNAILRTYFLKYVRYLDDLQTGLVAEEI